MRTFNHALVVHILLNIAIIAQCKYVEIDIALANDENTKIAFVNLQ